MKRLISNLVVLACFIFSGINHAYNIENNNIIKDVQHRWAELNYAKNNKETVKQLDALAEKTEMLVLDHPQDAEILIWNAIVLSTYAKAKGGLGALSLVKYAKLRLERALTINPNALNGSAYASLGTLYHKVPGWPIGFGSKKKADEYFAKALEINPNGLDINFFYADFLASRNKKELAITYLKKALSAPELVDRPIADAGRRAQAKALLKKLSG